MRPLLVVLALLLAPAAAEAGTIAVGAPPPCGDSQSKYGQCDPTPLVFTAAAGEVNRVTTRYENGSYVVRDVGAPIQPGGGCERVSEHEARCTSHQTHLTLHLGDGDDVGEGAAGRFDGGPGADTLRGVASAGGGPGDDVLRAVDTGPGGLLSGGAGDDTLIGGGAPDDLRGGPGRDVLHGGPNKDILDGDGGDEGPGGERATAGEMGGDVLDGGPGSDAATYVQQPVGVSVDLGTGATGRGATGDQLLGIENLTGSHHADDLRGDGSANVLGGAGGRDVIAGADGADDIDGGDGRDILAGDGGDDTIHGDGGSFIAGTFVRDPRGEPVSCGDGVDRVTVDDDAPAADCEFFGVLAVIGPRFAAGSVAVRVLCPRHFGSGGRCRGEIALHRIGARPPFATRAFSLRRGEGGWVYVRPRGATPPRMSVRLRFRGGPTARWRVSR